MPATNRNELLAVTEKEYAKLMKTLDGLDPDAAIAPGVEDGISIKDTIAHRTHWIDLFLGWYGDGKAGKPVQTPAPGYKWNQLKDYNAKVRAGSRDRVWPDVLDAFTRAHEALLHLLTSLDDAELYRPPQYRWMNAWTLGRWAEASGASHYRSANKYVRQILKTLRTPQG